MQGMMQPRLQRVMNATDNVFLFDVDRRPFCPHFRRSLSVAVATTRARFCGTRWLCWQSAANRSPVVKFPEHRKNTGNFIVMGAIALSSTLSRQSIGGDIP